MKYEIKYILIFLLLIKILQISAQEQKNFVIDNNDGAGELHNSKNINHYTTKLDFQDLKRGTLLILNPLDGSSSTLTVGNGTGTGTLVNSISNNFSGTEKKLFILTATHVLTKKCDYNEECNIWISFDYETSRSSAKRKLNDPKYSNIRKVYKIPVIPRVIRGDKQTLSPTQPDLTLLEVIFNDSNTDLNNNLAFFNSYSVGWDLHQYAPYSNISHPNNYHKQQYTDNQYVFIGNYNMSESMDDLPLFFLEDLEDGFGNFPRDHPSLFKNVKYGRYLFYNTSDKWVNTDTAIPEGGSGSGLINHKNRIVAVLSEGSEGGNYNTFSAIQNAWYDEGNLANNQLGNLMEFMDPNKTWISSTRGGYTKDLIPNEIPNNNFFNLVITTTPVDKTFNLSSLNFFKFENRLSNIEDILNHGVKTNTSLANNIYFTLTTFNNNFAYLNDNVLYGVQLNNSDANLQTLRFEGSGWPREDGIGPILPSLFEGNSDDIKNGILGYLRAIGNNESDTKLLSSFNFDAKLKLQTNTGTAQVRAVKLPNQMPYNARELFEDNPYANLWQSYKYSANRFNSEDLSINSITLKNWDKPKGVRTDTDEPIVNRTITTENNGGYLNLVNPNYSFSPVELSWADPKDATNSKDRFIELEIKLNKNITGPISFSVWIDYFNRDSYVGRNVSDKTYNFVFDEILNHPSELLASYPNIGANPNTTIDLPDDLTISINAKLPPIGFGPNNSYIGKKRLRIAVIEGATPPTQYLVNETLDGEVEDYLIDLVPPSDALNIEEQLAELLKNTGNIRLKKRKKSGDQNPTCEQGDETGQQLYDETGPEDNMGNQRTCSIWEGPCVSADDCALLYQQNTDAAGGELINLSGDNFVHVDRNGTYTKGNFDNGFTALTTYSPSNPFCENCDSEYILKQGSIQGDNDGDGGGDGDGDGWGIRLNPDAEDPEIELEVDVNNQQEIISVPLDEWLAQDPNQKFDIMVKKEQREIALMVRSQSTNTYDEEEMLLNTSVMNITQKTTLGGGVSQVYNNTTGTIDDLIFNITPTTNEDDKIIFQNATETTITYNKSDSTVGKDNNINTTKLNTETEDQPDFSLYPNPAKDTINILLEVRQEGPLYLDIYDMNGRQVYSINRPSITQGHQLITLPVQNLSAGNYILKIRAGDVVRSEKVLIKN